MNIDSESWQIYRTTDSEEEEEEVIERDVSKFSSQRV